MKNGSEDKNTADNGAVVTERSVKCSCDGDCGAVAIVRLAGDGLRQAVILHLEVHGANAAIVLSPASARSLAEAVMSMTQSVAN